MYRILETIRSPGKPLDSECRAFMERQFRADLSHVRVHTGIAAHVSCDALAARAYTVGNHIAFAKGHHCWQCADGRRLLAHELVHVLQQRDAALNFERGLPLGDENDLYEEEAGKIESLDVWACNSAATIGDSFGPTPRPAAAIYRAKTKICVAPSVALDVIFPGSNPVKILVSKAFGLIAEELITLDYLSKRPGKVLFDHYFDNPLVYTYLSFLISKNPHLRNPFTIALLLFDLQSDVFGIKRPDILTDMPGIKELYEIKPNSVSGLVEGRAKLAAIDGFKIVYRLVYPRGSTFTPTPSIVLASGTIPMIVGGPLPFELSLSVERTRPGLIQYKTCVETDFVKAAINELVLIAIILIIVVAKRVPKLPPVPVPGGLPIPTVF